MIGFRVRVYDRTRYLTLFGSKKYDAIYDFRIKYLISLKNAVTYIFSHYIAKIKVDSCDSLPIEKILRIIKSVLDKDKNHYYYKIILEKCSYQLIKNFFFII